MKENSCFLLHRHATSLNDINYRIPLDNAPSGIRNWKPILTPPERAPVLDVYEAASSAGFHH
eukprot:1138656-Pelagomonas_calceolata.AAC.3